MSNGTQPNSPLDLGMEDKGLALDALAQLLLSTSKVLRKKRRAPFAQRLHHAFRLFTQAHDAMVVIPDYSSPSLTPDLNLERATKFLHNTPALLQSSDGHCS